MRHRHHNRILGRNAQERVHLLRNLSAQLLLHESIVTTHAKAQELRKFFEPLVTKAKGEMTLSSRRRLLQDLNGSDIERLQTVAKANENRPGGYVRLTKLPITRHDGAQEVRVDIVTS